MKHTLIRSLLIAAVAGVAAPALQAAVITPGFTFAVASSSDTSFGTHFHSNTGGAFGNPAGKAEVGAFSTEEVRGLSEYNLAGLVAGPAFVTFDVFSAGGLFSGTNDFPFTGTIDIYAYTGNNTEDISDYEAAATSLVGSFSTSGLAVGDILSFDITSELATALGNSDSSMGIRLQTNGGRPSNGGAWTFDDFRLTSTDDTTNRVPEGGGAVVLLFGVTLAGMARVRRLRA